MPLTGAEGLQWVGPGRGRCARSHGGPGIEFGWVVFAAAIGPHSAACHWYQEEKGRSHSLGGIPGEACCKALCDNGQAPGSLKNHPVIVGGREARASLEAISVVKYLLLWLWWFILEPSRC